jgi:hypothetical protein
MTGLCYILEMTVNMSYKMTALGVKDSESRLNRILNKPESCVNWTLDKIPILERFVILASIKWTPVSYIAVKPVRSKRTWEQFLCSKDRCSFYTS